MAVAVAEVAAEPPVQVGNLNDPIRVLQTGGLVLPSVWDV